jgi:hypothetical protein
MAIPQALTPEQIAQIVAAGRGNTVNIGGTLYGGNWADIGDGESRQEGQLQNIYGSTGIDQAGQPYYEYSPTGSFVRQGVTNKSQSFFGGLADSLKDPVVLAALGGAAYGGLLGGAGAGATGLTASELASADMALGGAGGTAGAEALSSAAAAGSTGLTASQLANLAKAGISIAGLTAGANALSNTGNTRTTSGTALPTQAQPQYTQDYYNQLQNTYNQLMPGVPRDVVSNLASWYGTGDGTPTTQDTGITSGLFGKELAAVKPTTPTTTTPTNLGSAAYQWATNQGGMTGQQYLNNINQWILDNPNASLADINAIKSKLGVSDVDVQTALGQSNFSDATKYALTHNMGLSDVNQNIVDWIAKNPSATNAQIQAEQAKYSISDADIARALTDKNSSAAQEYAIIHDMGLDQYYKNIANAAQSGITPQEAVAQMKQYGVSPTDVQTAYSMFAPKTGLTLDEVLAAYK